jgi:PKD repeat protein
MRKTIRPCFFLGLLATVFATVFATLLAPSAAFGGTCTDGTCQFISCRSPAFGVPSQLWGELEPVDVGQLPANRDNTNFDPIIGPYNETQPRWMSLDIAGNTLYAVINFGLQVWDITGANAANPSLLTVLNRNNFAYWTPGFTEEKNPVRDVDAPDGNNDVLAVALVNDSGLNVFDTTNHANPVAIYADKGRNGLQVYSTHIGANDYAFMASRQKGVTVYNLTTAKNLPARCVDESPASTSCGPYVRRLGTRNITAHVSGTGNFVAVSSGAFDLGVEVWDVSNPASPSLEIDGLGTEFVHGISLWQKGAKYYMAMIVNRSGGIQFRIYDVSCLASGSCSGLGSPVFSQNLPGGGTEFFTTYSQSNGRDFVFVGTVYLCTQLTQNEWLYDVSTPAAASDITPPDALVNGSVTGYWGWYYRRNPTGFNNTAGRVGRFKGSYFYRAAFNLFDIHKVTTSAPAANFTYSPSEVYEGQPIDFFDTSTGGPTGFSWSFQDATPASSSQADPQNVEFNSTGSKTVDLTVSNGFGNDSIQKVVAVLEPSPTVGSVAASPNPALVCQPVTFTAQNVTGLPPLAFDWEVQDGGGVVATGGNVNPFVWDSTGFADGLYTATVTVTNGSGSDSATSPSVELQPLPTLAFTSPGNAPETLNGPPFASGSVEFRIQSTGATEWRWNFGDGTPPVWSSNPTTGPMPTHTYTDAGLYSVTVEIRNCAEAAIASNATVVTIINTTPLVANFSVQGLFCTGVGCFTDTGVPATFVDLSEGDPDFYDYDWNGDGTYESIDNPNPITLHTFYETGNFTPVLKVRRGTEPPSVFPHGQLIVVSGAALALPVVSISGPGSGETGQSLAYSVSATNCSPAPTQWHWNVGDGVISGGASGSSINVSFGSPGARTFRVTPLDGQCAGYQGTLPVTITVSGAFLFADNFESGNLANWAAVVP